MTAGPRNQLPVREAAQLLFKVRHPNDEQIQFIRRKLADGTLTGNLRGERVNVDSFAQFMAGLSRRQDRKRRRIVSNAGDPPQQDLEESYRSGLQEYFAAVLRFRRPEAGPAGWQRAVVAGQIVFVVTVMGLLIASLVAVTARPTGQQEVEEWLAANVKQPQVIEWFPAAEKEEHLEIRVRYKYLSGSRGVVTDRVFSIKDGEVIEVDSYGD